MVRLSAGWLQFARPSADEVRAILDLPFEHVLPGHGFPVIGDARAKYTPAITGPLKAPGTKKTSAYP